MQISTLIDLGWNHFFQSQLTLNELETQLPFRVIGVQRNLIDCIGLDAENQAQQVQISTYHWRNDESENHPTVGDWLMLDTDFQPLKLLERKSQIQRKAAGHRAYIQMIAANLDTLFITSSCNDDFNLNRIERYLAIAAETNIHAVLVLTKKDLSTDPSEYLEQLQQSLPLLLVELVNATDPESVTVLKSWIGNGQTVALVGSSGVGKSTLTNMLKGKNDQDTAGIRESDSKGRHTTTSRSLHLLPDGGLLLDTPGMRELQIVDSEESIHATFADISELAQSCRFGDCSHHNEPGCVVMAEVETGKLDPRRLQNYQKLLLEQARNNESIAQRRQSDRALGKFYKQAKISAKHFKSRG
ncbi:ribosome small subunit-dependent GTPase A [Neptuniibacter sp. SY11_33]|uniref:ribosome small subunit-dependent GTPase A n=1 Tax=Neptuniibacter sp. SY11_33 TaxID=3398215 RepID=UPI0039F59857